MVSTVKLDQIDQRLKQAFPENSREPFGGLSIVMMGDYRSVPTYIHTYIQLNIPICSYFFLQPVATCG